MRDRLIPRRECAKQNHPRRAVVERYTGAKRARWLACEACGSYLCAIGAAWRGETVADFYAHHHHTPGAPIVPPRAA